MKDVLLSVVAMAASLLFAAALWGRPEAARPKCVVVGEIEGYVRTVVRTPCTDRVRVGSAVHRRDRLRTLRGGQLTFHTRGIDRCIMYSGARDVIAPRTQVLLRHERGTLWCRQAPGKKGKLRAPGTAIRISGTVFGITSTRRRSVIKVAEGALTVAPTRGAKRPLRVEAGEEVAVPARGPRTTLRSRNLRSTAIVDRAVLSLRDDVITTEEGELPRVFAPSRVGEQRVILISEDETIEKRILPLLHGTRLVGAWRRADFFADENLEVRLRRTRPQTAVIAGSFRAMTPVIERLREIVPDIGHVFVPAR